MYSSLRSSFNVHRKCFHWNFGRRKFSLNDKLWFQTCSLFLLEMIICKWIVNLARRNNFTSTILTNYIALHAARISISGSAAICFVLNGRRWIWKNIFNSCLSVATQWFFTGYKNQFVIDWIDGLCKSLICWRSAQDIILNLQENNLKITLKFKC